MFMVAKMGSHCGRGQVERHLIVAIAASPDVAESIIGLLWGLRWDRRLLWCARW